MWIMSFYQYKILYNVLQKYIFCTYPLLSLLSEAKMLFKTKRESNLPVVFGSKMPLNPQMLFFQLEIFRIFPKVNLTLKKGNIAFFIFPWKLCTSLGTKIVFGSVLTRQLKSQSQSQTTKNGHTLLIELRQN